MELIKREKHIAVAPYVRIPYLTSSLHAQSAEMISTQNAHLGPVKKHKPHFTRLHPLHESAH